MRQTKHEKKYIYIYIYKLYCLYFYLKINEKNIKKGIKNSKSSFLYIFNTSLRIKKEN